MATHQPSRPFADLAFSVVDRPLPLFSAQSARKLKTIAPGNNTPCAEPTSTFGTACFPGTMIHRHPSQHSFPMSYNIYTTTPLSRTNRPKYTPLPPQHLPVPRNMPRSSPPLIRVGVRFRNDKSTPRHAGVSPLPSETRKPDLRTTKKEDRSRCPCRPISGARGTMSVPVPAIPPAGVPEGVSVRARHCWRRRTRNTSTARG